MKQAIVVLAGMVALAVVGSLGFLLGKDNRGPNKDGPVAGTAQNAPAPKTAKERMSYAIAMDLGGRLRKASMDVDQEMFMRGLKDALAGGKTLLTEQDVLAVMSEMQNELKGKQASMQTEKMQQATKEGEAFLAANKTKAGVVALPSGLQYKILKAGDGKTPTAADTVVCNYRGALIDGTEFANSQKAGKPATFPVKTTIKGWAEALQIMPVGSKWQVFIPPSLAYGERGLARSIGPNAVVVLEVELVAIKDVSTGAATQNATTGKAERGVRNWGPATTAPYDAMQPDEEEDSEAEEE